MASTRVPRGTVTLDVVDTHTEGEPTRIVFGGWPALRGRSVAAKRDDQRTRFDGLRTALLWEPRGHSDQFGAVLVSPSSRGADHGLFFMDADGYLDMCGHATMAVTVALLERSPGRGGSRDVSMTYETPAGLVTAHTSMRRGKVGPVAVVDVPSLVLGSTVVEVDRTPVPVDLAYGGNVVGIVDASVVGLEVRRERLPELLASGRAILRALAERRDVSLSDSHRRGVDLVMLTGEPELPGSHGKNVVIWGAGQFDRSPCGTGTAARLALLHAQGRLRPGEWFVHESIVNTTFRARILDVVRGADGKAVVPEISGRAFVTQRSTVVLDPRDPLRDGVRVRG